MRQIIWTGLIGAIVSVSTAAQAGELPLYQPAPDWVVAAPLPDIAKLPADAPAILVHDSQQRIEAGRLWSYEDRAMRISSPEMLSQFATLTLPWMPDKGDLIVHELAILRGGQRIDLLAQGQKFTVLRNRSSSASSPAC